VNFRSFALPEFWKRYESLPKDEGALDDFPAPGRRPVVLSASSQSHSGGDYCRHADLSRRNGTIEQILAGDEVSIAAHEAAAPNWIDARM